ncbi:hypothetical protein [Azospirillum rugosum]|uniref:Uncharacterized protein n=1 Tax=Azospirillum rugosum TaxID=416170 RepID=A0ABS4SJ96_9PROT|nr:hypothetical protein [Azospirillum rugosum]MBP2292629.1 hypothetical protein [Azospirillum rugosum]MDQ0526347.1 hypothetical protein [Azospirillum rugosum]
MDDMARVAGALLFGLSNRMTRRRRLRPQDEEPRNADTRVETRDAPLWLIGCLAGIAVSLIVVVVVALRLIFPHAVQDQPKQLAAPMPEPRLQTSPVMDMRAYRAEAERKLHSYGWVDRDRGIAREPIDEAMRRLAERGIPDWPGAKP